MNIMNRTTSRFEAHLVYKHTQNPDFLLVTLVNTRDFTFLFYMSSTHSCCSWKVTYERARLFSWIFFPSWIGLTAIQAFFYIMYHVQ